MPRPSRFHLVNLQSGLGLVIVLLLAVITSPRSARGARIFLEVGNLTDILRQVSEIGIIVGAQFVRHKPTSEVASASVLPTPEIDARGQDD